MRSLDTHLQAADSVSHSLPDVDLYNPILLPEFGSHHFILYMAVVQKICSNA